ncbi:MAG: polyprotein [Pedersore iflavirus]|nr:MAG: polyprotein [Pedersore iflavirus]
MFFLFSLIQIYKVIMQNVKNNDCSRFARRPRIPTLGTQRKWIYVGDGVGAAYGRETIGHTELSYPVREVFEEMGKSSAAWLERFDANRDYTSYVNSWAYANNMVCEKTTQRQQLCEGRRVWEFERAMSIASRVLVGYGFGHTLKEAKQMCDFAITQRAIDNAVVQMDGEGSKESVQGQAIQSSDKAENTIVTRDSGKTVSSHSAEHKASDFASSERIVSLDNVTRRWMPLHSVAISSADKADKILASYYLPETLFKEVCNSINLLPFEAFIYGQYDIRMKFVLNANKFQCGRIIASVKFDSYQADTMQKSINAALGRPHVMLDLGSNVEGELKIPFRYHRAFVRNVKNDQASKGIRPSKFASVVLQVMSELRVGTEATTTAYIRPYIMFERAQFAGMSYRVSVQMDMAMDSLKLALPTQEVRSVLSGAEKLLQSLGDTRNRDKPSVIGGSPNIPRPRMNFGTGKGLVDVIPLKMNPYAMTSFTHVKPFPDEPKTMLDIAQIWSLKQAEEWKASDKPGSKLMDTSVDPSMRDGAKGYSGNPSYLEWVVGHYAFWAGTIEGRLDFISNGFHTGAVMICIEFGRPVVVEDNANAFCDASSTYTKTFHLGEQRSVSFTIPYIYDTVWRRSNLLTYQPDIHKPNANDDVKSTQTGIRTDCKTRLRVWVVNELKPVSNASQTIEMMFYWRASREFMVHGLKQASFYPTRETTGVAPYMDNFPKDGYKPVDPVVLPAGTATANAASTSGGTKKKREAGDFVHVPKYSWAERQKHDVPKELRNEWNEVDAYKITTQMDKGEKEDLDPTRDFNKGKFNLPLQTNDSQVSLKDILRRPVLILNSVTVKGYKTESNKTCGYWIPLMPPSREMQWHEKHTDNLWCEMVGATPQASIMNTMRFWRGCQRYTIVVEEKPGKIVYVTHMPHTGVRITGNFVPGSGSSPAQRVIAGSGLSTDFISTTVNPTAVFEAPYDTENDWTLTFEEDAQRSYSWRDKGDTNAGHIIVSCKDDVTVSVWWSAGDDFEIGNFYGVPACGKDDHLYMFTDEHARVQMDFQQSDSSYYGRTVKVLKGAALPAMLSTIPLVGNSLAVGYGAHKLDGVLSTATDTIHEWKSVGTTANRVLDQVSDQAQQLGADMQCMKVQVNNITDQCSATITVIHEKIASILDTLSAGAKILPTVRQTIEHVLLDILSAWLTQSWTVVGVGIVRIVNTLIGGSAVLVEWGIKLASCIQTMISPNAHVQAPPSQESTMVGIICGLIGTVMNVTINPSEFGSWQKQLLRVFTTNQGVSYLNQVLRFVQQTFECIKEVTLRALGLVDPEVEAVRMLCQNGGQIKEFIADAQHCMNEANTSLMLAPAFRRKFWATTVRAYQYQRALLTAGPNLASPPLLRFCQDVIKHATEKFVDLSCSPVRYEPFVLCFTGAPGIGKSFMTNKVAKILMDAVGFNRVTAGLTYTRPPGHKYWSSYRDQPVIVYDDWLNLNSAESIEQQISELYQMKSTSRFIPEMAHLEEKRISANPMMVMLLCNDAFPSVMKNVAIHTDAVYRRRDLVVDVRLKATYTAETLRDVLANSSSEDLDHLEFAIYTNATKESSLVKTYYPYRQFIEWLIKVYQRYHAIELRNVRNRVDELACQLQLAPNTLGDPFELLYTAQTVAAEISQNAWTPAEQLEAAVQELISVLDAVDQRPPIIIPPVPAAMVLETPVEAEAERARTQGFFGELAALLPKIGTAVVTTPAMTGWLLKASWAKFLELLPVEEMTFLEMGNCVICLGENVPLHMKCGNSTTNTPHTICVGCVQQGLELRTLWTCPVCRSADLRTMETRATTWWLMLVRWIRQTGRYAITPLLEEIGRVLNVVPMRMVYWVHLLINWVRLVVNPRDTLIRVVPTVAHLVTDMVMRPSVDVFEEASQHRVTTIEALGLGILEATVNGVNVVQMEEMAAGPSHTLPPIQPMPEEEPEPQQLFDVVQFRDDLWSGYVSNVERPRCLHDELLAQAVSAQYKYNPELDVSEWLVTAMDQGRAVYAYVQDGACSDVCPFRNEASVREFYRRYVRANRDRLRRWLIDYHNGIGQVAQMSIAKVPRMIRPQWTDLPTIELPQNDWWTYLGEKYEKYKVLIHVCLGITATVSSLIAIGKLWDWYKAPQAQGDINYNAHEQRQLRRVVQPKRVQPERMRVQAEDLLETVREQVIRNYVLLKIWKADKVYRQLILTGLCGKYALMPRHYIKALEENRDERITLEPALFMNGDKNHLRLEYAWDPVDCEELLNTDLAFIKLPNTYPSFKNIRKFIQTEKDLAGYYPNEGEILLAPTRKRQGIMSKCVDLLGIEQRVKFDDSDGTTFWATDLLKYGHSEDGACGSIVIVADHQRPIRAMHVAGTNTDIGYGVLLTQELIRELAEEKIMLQYEETTLENIGEREDAMIFSEETRVDYLGAVPKTKIPHAPKKSKIRPSMIQNLLPEPATQPCILHPADGRYTHEKSPLWYGAAKHGKVTKDYTTTQVQEAKQAIWDTLLCGMKPSVLHPKRLTVDEAIVGVDNVDFYDPMRLDTSAGYPWQLEGSDTTKREWITVERNDHGEVVKVEIKDQLKQEIERKETLRKQGIVPATIFVDTLKDERKLKHKVVKQGGTRVFCASPVDYTIATRQNLLHFCAAFMKKRLGAWHAVGINAKGPEWTELYRRLTNISPYNIVMMDYSNFGPGFNGVVAEAAADLITEWTMSNVEGCDQIELKCLLMECTNSVHIAGPTVYRQYAGSPSGAAITTIINTLVNLLYMVIAWRALAGEKARKIHPDIYHVMSKKTCLIAYGDDFIMSVADDFKELFNTNTIKNFFSKNGIVATSAEKDLIDTPDFVTIREASFLKRGFRAHDTRSEMILGPLDKTAMEEIPKWIWQCSDKKAATRVNVESALLEAHAHGPQYFNEWKNELNKQLARKGIATTGLSWKDLDEQWFVGEMPMIDVV